MHFVGPVVDAREARVTIHPGQRRVLRHAHRAMHLDRAIDNVVQYLRAAEFDQ